MSPSATRLLRGDDVVTALGVILDMRHRLSASAGVDEVKFVSHHRHGAAIVEAERPGAGGRLNAFASGQDVLHAMQWHA
jgi:hypothetical protein